MSFSKVQFIDDASTKENNIMEIPEIIIKEEETIKRRWFKKILEKEYN